MAIRIRPGGCLINNTEDTIIYGGNYIKINDSGIILERQLDKVFGPSAAQEEVYNFILLLVESCDKDINSAFLAYRQSGSGKKYTMLGNEHNYVL